LLLNNLFLTLRRLITHPYSILTVFPAHLFRYLCRSVFTLIPRWIRTLIDAYSIIILLWRIIQIANSRNLELSYQRRWTLSRGRSRRIIRWFSGTRHCYPNVGWGSFISICQIEGNRLWLGDHGWACLPTGCNLGIISSKFVIPCILFLEGDFTDVCIWVEHHLTRL